MVSGHGAQSLGQTTGLDTAMKEFVDVVTFPFKDFLNLR